MCSDAHSITLIYVMETHAWPSANNKMNHPSSFGTSQYSP